MSDQPAADGRTLEPHRGCHVTRGVFTALAIEPVRMVAGLWGKRDLVRQFTRRNIELRHRGSRLGAVWALINPLSMLVLYYVVFGVLYGTHFRDPARETPFDVLLAMFLGLSLFHAFSETLSWAPSLIASNPNFVKKVVFPLEVLPLAQIGAATFHLSISLGLIVAGGFFSTDGLGWDLLWLPVLVAPLLMLSLGTAWLLAALGVFVRDIGQLSAFVVTVLLFASAAMFPAARIADQSEVLWRVLQFNPVLQVIDLARRVVLWHEPMSTGWLAYVYTVGFVALIAGAIFFSLLRRSFAEVI